jgi:hypothetical protein
MRNGECGVRNEKLSDLAKQRYVRGWILQAFRTPHSPFRIRMFPQTPAICLPCLSEKRNS